MQEKNNKNKKDLSAINKNDQKKVRDSRFEFAEYDPRFQIVPKSIRKTKVDERFQHMFKNKDFMHVTEVDRYGRKIENSKKNKELLDLYYNDSNESENI